MTKLEFHEAFEELSSSFPLSRLGDTVEHNWYKRFQQYSAFKVRAAFALLATETRFPTLGNALGMVRDIGSNEVSYVAPEYGFCYKDMLGEGRLQCGCGNCHPEIYKRFAERYHNTYGRWPWDRTREPGKLEKRAIELTKNPGGREGFIQLLKELGEQKKEKLDSGFTKLGDTTISVP